MDIHQKKHYYLAILISFCMMMDIPNNEQFAKCHTLALSFPSPFPLPFWKLQCSVNVEQQMAFFFLLQTNLNKILLFILLLYSGRMLFVLRKICTYVSSRCAGVVCNSVDSNESFCYFVCYHILWIYNVLESAVITFWFIEQWMHDHFEYDALTMNLTLFFSTH